LNRHLKFAPFCVLVVALLVGCVEEGAEVVASTDEPQDDFKTLEVDIALEDLVARRVEARGGAEVLANLQTMRLEGSFWSQQESSSTVEDTVVVTLAPGRYHRVLEGSGHVDAVDVDSAWRLSPDAGIIEPIPLADEDAARYRRQGDLSGALVDADSKGHSLELQDKIEDEGKAYFRVRVDFAEGGSALYFIDAETFLVQRIREKRKIEGFDITQVTSFDKYKPVEGLAVAHVEKVHLLEADFLQKSTWEKITINPELPPDFFAKPSSS
jgi:hypothetical protein